MQNQKFLGIDEALKKGYVLLVYRDMFGLIEVDILESLEKRRPHTGAKMPSLEEALEITAERFLNGKGFMLNFYSGPDREAKTNLDEWLLRGHNIVARINKRMVVLNARRKWDNEAIRSSSANYFKKAYNLLDSSIDDYAFRRAEDPRYMFK